MTDFLMVGVVVGLIILLSFYILKKKSELTNKDLEKYSKNFDVNKLKKDKIYIPEDAVSFIAMKTNSKYSFENIFEIIDLEVRYLIEMQNSRKMFGNLTKKDEDEDVKFEMGGEEIIKYIQLNKKNELTQKQIEEILKFELEYMSAIGIK